MRHHVLIPALLACLAACSSSNSGGDEDAGNGSSTADAGGTMTASSSRAQASSTNAPSSTLGSTSAATSASTMATSAATSQASTSSQGTASSGSAASSAGFLPGSETTDHTCITNSHWLLGNLKTGIMHPGVDCIACHAMHGGAPTFTAAGTVNASLHDDDDCRGVSGVTVEITPATGAVITLTTNTNGNFYYEGALATPYQARILKNGSVRAMATHQTAGACTSCHTVDGTGGAPGRIVAP